MTKHSLTTSESKIIESEDDKRCYLFTAGLFSGCVTVYLRIGDIGGADVMLTKEGTTALEFIVPRGRPVYAWTNAGTAELCETKVS